MDRYLVTGGAGFIGSHIVEALLEEGAYVRVLDNFSSGKRENLESAATGGTRKQLEVVEGDIRDADALTEAVKGANVVFHEAAFVSVPESMARPAECFDVNVAGTSQLFDAARDAGVRRVVIASSAAVYGDSKIMPLDESAQTKSMSPYAASKRACEIYAGLYSRSMGLEVASLRYFNVYGPRQRPDSQYAAAVPAFIERLLAGRSPTVFGNGKQSRDLIFVKDVVKANLTAATHARAIGEILNVCTGTPTPILELLDVLYKLIPGSPAPVFEDKRAGDIYESRGNPERALREIGFAASTSLESGLQDTIECMR